ncbi:hypothetical protein AJ87_47765 [Rhizobium yanglingense]|nr:hypothetical protein AJ87_47765 [Rhizobium yanglingense]
MNLLLAALPSDDPKRFTLLPSRFGPTGSAPPPKLPVIIEARRTSSRAGLFIAQADACRKAGPRATAVMRRKFFAS